MTKEEWVVWEEATNAAYDRGVMHGLAQLHGDEAVQLMREAKGQAKTEAEKMWARVYQARIIAGVAPVNAGGTADQAVCYWKRFGLKETPKESDDE